MVYWLFGFLRWSQVCLSICMMFVSILTYNKAQSSESSTGGAQIHPTLASLSSSSLYDKVPSYDYEEHILPYQRTKDDHNVENVVPSSSGVELEVTFTEAVHSSSAIVENSNSNTSPTEFTRQHNLYRAWDGEVKGQRKNLETSENSPKNNMDTVIVSSEFVPTVTFMSTSGDADIEGRKAIDTQILSGYMDSMIKTDSNVSEDHGAFTITSNDMNKYIKPSVSEGHCGANSQDVCTQ